MDYTVPIRRIYQFEKWKWLLMVGLVAATHLFCQSLMLPYGNALLSLIPEGTVHEKVELISKQSAAIKSVILDDPLIDNVSNLVNKSLLTRSIKLVGQTDAIAGSRDDEIIMTEETEKENQVLFDNAVDFVEDANLDNDMAYEIGNKDELDSVESDDQAHDFDLENDGEIKASLSLEQVVEPKNHTLSDKMPSSSIMMKTELTSTNSLVNVTFSGNLASNVSIVNSSNFDASLGEKETIAFPSEGSSVLLHTHTTGSSNNSALVSNLAKKKMKCQMPPKTITPMPEMERLLVHHRAHSRAMRPRWSSERDREILSAKVQIENAPVIRNDRELYAPLFRNVSTFKKSYELMEQILKIYVYKEGTKPIFHQPILKGLYASEGWFMKLMEGNKRFVVKDPRRAHLFYMPFSSRMLEYRLYVRNSHNRTNLRQYLRDYAEKISSKHRYWNRTGGADHFLVACHDWAPYETRHHMEHCMKALCNADVTLGFKLGRDVSLPETYVRSARNPLRDLGGKPASERHTLAFYAGNMHGYLRPILLKHWKDKDPDMKIFGPMPSGVASKMNYIQHMKSSKYCICPKGYEVNSPRVVEAIFYECVPVIISDNFVPPFFEVLNWSAFSVILAEKDIPNLKEILLSIPEAKYLELQSGVRKVQQHFLWHAKPLKFISRVRRTVHGSSDDIGWLQNDTEMAPVEDGSSRFLELLQAISNQGPLYFVSTKRAFSKMGLACHIAKIHSEASVEKNAWELKHYIEELYWGSGKRVMLLGHSKGGVDAAAALSIDWGDLEDKVAGLAFVQSPYGGTPVAADILREGQIADKEIRRIMEFLICNVIKGDITALEDLTYDKRKEFVKKNKLPDSIPLTSFHSEANTALNSTMSHIAHSEIPWFPLPNFGTYNSVHTVQATRSVPVIVPVSAALAICALHLELRYEEKSDGLVTCRDAEVPGSVVVKPDRKLDHSWMVYSSWKKNPFEPDSAEMCEALLTLLVELGKG